MPIQPPDASTRWRCVGCGNLTRFDVSRRTLSRDFVHADLSGTQVVEDREVIEDVIEHVTCRWCGNLDSVELVPRPGSGSAETVSGSA